MGLDMFLTRYPRYKGYRPEEIEAVDDYLGYMDDEMAKSKYTFKEWCGLSEEGLPSKKDIDYFKNFRIERYSVWDEEKRHPHKRVSENVAYWRKANAIHRWFVKNVQGGIDDCGIHEEVTEEKIEELRGCCRKVLEGCVLVVGKVANGESLTDSGWVKNYEVGKKILNPGICKKYLPSTDGFFFGSTEYDQYYWEDVKYTYDVLGKVLQETDFDNQMIYYQSSW